MRKLSILGPLSIIILWIFFSELKITSPLLLPSFFITIKKLFSLLCSIDFYSDIKMTAYRWFWGYVLGCLAGIPIGLLMGTYKQIYYSLEFVIEFFRSLPVTALFPLFLLMFGIGDGSKIAMTFTATIFVVIINSAYGVIQSKKQRIKVAQIFGATKWQIFSKVILFESLPQTVVGMRTSLSLSLIVVVVSEMFIGTKYGMGQRIFDAYTRNSIDELYAVILTVGIAGFLLNKVFIKLENKIIFWAGK